MKTRMKRMKKPTSKITLLLSNHKTVLYSRLENAGKVCLDRLRVFIVSICSGPTLETPANNSLSLTVSDVGAVNEGRGDS